MKTRTTITLLAFSAAATLFAGCQSTPEAGATARPYPQAMQQFGTLDIQVFRRSRDIEFTNTTPRKFGPSTLWINRRYAYDIASIAVGETVTLPLEAFVDENGERFRAGGFFAADIPDIIALAQLETSGSAAGAAPADDQKVLLGLITVKAGAN